MGMKLELIKMAIRKKLDENAESIQAEKDRLKALRGKDEIVAYAKEKGVDLRDLVREHGPAAKERIKAQWKRLMDKSD